MNSDADGATQTSGSVRTRAVEWILFGFCVALSLLAITTYEDNAYSAQAVRPATDYFHTVWRPGADVLEGRNPYPAPDSTSLAGAESVYPPALFVVASPLSLLAFDVAKWIWIAVLMAATVSAFILVGVRDVRALTVVMLSAPVVSGLMWGNATLLVGFAAALAWRLRHRANNAALAYAAGAAIKILLLPLLAWLLFTGRMKAATRGVIYLVVILIAGWAAIGFDGLREYPALLQTLTAHWIGHGLFLSALLANHGSSSSLAVLVGGIPALCLLAVAWAMRRSEVTAFGLTLIAVLYLTPVTHVYNLELMLLAIACASPRLSPAWVLMPMTWWTTWSTPLQQGDYDWLVAYSIGLTAGAVGVVLAVGMREMRGHRRRGITRVLIAKTAL